MSGYCLYCHNELLTEQKDGKKGLLRTYCCGRPICVSCDSKNGRQQCIYCPLNPAEPPADDDDDLIDDDPPAYEAVVATTSVNTETGQPEVIHYIGPEDTVASLALSYGVDSNEIRKRNKIFSDPLIAGRSFVYIPNYHGMSRSSAVDADTERKRKIKRFQIAAKCVDYQVSLAYMNSNDYDLDRALARYKEDIAWEASTKKGR